MALLSLSKALLLKILMYAYLCARKHYLTKVTNLLWADFV